MTARPIALMNDGMCPSAHHAWLVLAAVAALALGGCARIDMPSQVSEQRIVLESDNYAQSYKTASVGAAQFDEIGDHFRRHGNGQAEVIVSYDPYSKKNTAMKATDQLHRIIGELNRRQVKDIRGSILAADYSGDESEMIVGYNSVSAQPPEGCGMMPGSDVMKADLDPNYKLGCSVQTMVSRQVARPADLAGRAPDMGDGDGRRARTVVERYRAGEPYDNLRRISTQ